MITTKRNIKFLEVNEIEKIVSACPDDNRGRRDRALLELLFSTGLRISEALALSDAPFVKEAKGTLELSITGKAGWQRVIFVSPIALKAVKSYLEYRTDDDLLLFPITVRRVQMMIKERAKKAGIEKRVTPHMIRHSFATDLLRKGVDIRMVQEFLGHRSISSTQVYTHVTNSPSKEVHKKLY